MHHHILLSFCNFILLLQFANNPLKTTWITDTSYMWQVIRPAHGYVQQYPWPTCICPAVFLTQLMSICFGWRASCCVFHKESYIFQAFWEKNVFVYFTLLVQCNLKRKEISDHSESWGVQDPKSSLFLQGEIAGVLELRCLLLNLQIPSFQHWYPLLPKRVDSMLKPLPGIWNPPIFWQIRSHHPLCKECCL